jgi:hypothetical protein
LPVVDFLRENMISSWSLVKELQDLIDDANETERYKKLAQAVLDAYKFPVEMSLFCPNGQVLKAINANDYLNIEDDPLESSQDYNRDPGEVLSEAYVKFLKEGTTSISICNMHS